MRARTLIATAVLFLAVSCGQAPDNGGLPDYRVVNEARAGRIGAVDRVMPGATSGQARRAIERYAARIGDEPDLFFIMVIHSEDANRYVCRARWYRDRAAAVTHGGKSVPTDAWPALQITCPPAPRARG